MFQTFKSLGSLNQILLNFALIQLWTFPYVGYENEGTLRVSNTPLKCCKTAELLIYIGWGLISFHTVNIGFVGQRAAKLLSFKL